METKTIQSWRHQKVRVKEEYIVKEKEIDEDASTYDDDYNIIEEVYCEKEYISSDCGLGSVLSGKERDIFEVAADFYGVDFYLTIMFKFLLQQVIFKLI